MVNFQPGDFGEDVVEDKAGKPTSKVCPHCGKSVDTTANVCPYCNLSLEELIQVDLFPEFPRQRLRRLLRPQTILLAVLIVTVTLGLYGFLVVQRLSSDYYIETGDRFLSDGDNASAARYYQQAVQFSPQNPEPYERLAWSEYQLAQDADALKHFEDALSLSSDRILSLYGAGLAAYQLHDYEKSSSYLTHLIGIQPGYTAAYEYLGLAEYRVGRYENAYEYLTRAWIYNPQNGTALYYLGRIHALNGEGGLAVEKFNQAEKAGFDPSSISYARGLAEMQSGEYESALRDLQKAFDAYPARTDAALALTKALYLLKDYPAAQAQVANIQTDNLADLQSEYLALSGWIAIRQGYTDAARSIFNRWLNFDPKNEQALNALGWASYYAADCQTANFYFESASESTQGEWLISGDSLSSMQETPQIGLTSQCPVP